MSGTKELSEADRATLAEIHAKLGQDQLVGYLAGKHAGVAAERERCARFADERAAKLTAEGRIGTFIASEFLYRRDECNKLAAAIRAQRSNDA